MHWSSLVQESFNYLTLLCHRCIWKADAVTSWHLALPRQGEQEREKVGDREQRQWVSTSHEAFDSNQGYKSGFKGDKEHGVI